MTVKYSVAVRNAGLDARVAAIGASPRIELRTGSPTTNITDSPTGTLLATLVAGATWMQAASNGIAILQTVITGSAVAAGTVGWFRILDSTGTTAHIMGTATASGGGGDMVLDNPVLAVSQAVNITALTITAGNS